MTLCNLILTKPIHLFINNERSKWIPVNPFFSFKSNMYSELMFKLQHAFKH